MNKNGRLSRIEEFFRRNPPNLDLLIDFHQAGRVMRATVPAYPEDDPRYLPWLEQMLAPMTDAEKEILRKAYLIQFAGLDEIAARLLAKWNPTETEKEEILAAAHGVRELRRWPVDPAGNPPPAGDRE